MKNLYRCIGVYIILRTYRKRRVERHGERQTETERNISLLRLLGKNQLLPLTPSSAIFFDVDSFDFLTLHKLSCS